MMGHGNWHCFYSMSHKPRSIRYTLNHAMTGLAEGEPVPPLVIFACTTGHFAREADCLTEALLLAPGGPVAAVGATTESHPLMNYYAGVCLLKALNGKHPTIGELWETAQSRAVKAHDPLMEPLLRDVEGKLEENINIPKLRRDQLLMYALLGDPATRIKFPLPLKVDVERREDGWRWRVQRPDAATRLRVGTREPKPRPPAPKSTEEEEMRALQVKANSIFRFDTIAELGPDDKWEGTVAKGGLFRFVAWGNGALYTGTLEIEEPPDSRAQ